MNLDKIMKKYGLITKQQRKEPEEVKEELAEYISHTVGMTFKDVERNTDLSIKLVRSFKNKLSSMTQEERDYLIAMIMLDKTLETGLPSEESDD